jgi:glycerophosphoryl diester phosphodiesterase
MTKIKIRRRQRRSLLFLVVMGVAASIITPLVAFHAAKDPVDALTPAELQARMSAVRAFNTCRKQVAVVAHTGTASEGSHSKLDVDTVPWINAQIKRGHNLIELDEQVSSDGHGFAFHDRKLNAESRGGSGTVHSHSIKYLKKVRSNHGDEFATAQDLIKILRHHHGVTFQHEFKDYDSQWSAQDLANWYQEFAAAGVMDQIHISSASGRVLNWFHANHPEIHNLQLIGFENYLPDLGTALSVGASQVNVSSDAALHPYGDHANYLAAARDRGLKTSVRSKPNGNGDNGRTWLKAISFGVDQIVTQGPTKAEVCNAVRKAAN